MTSRLPRIALVLATVSGATVAGAACLLAATGGFPSPLFIRLIVLICLGFTMSLPAIVLAAYSFIRYRSATAFVAIVLCMALYVGSFSLTEPLDASSGLFISFDANYDYCVYYGPTPQLRVMLVVLGVALPPLIGLFWRQGGQISLRMLLLLPVILAAACMLIREDIVRASAGRLSFQFYNPEIPMAAAAISTLVTWTALRKPLVERSESSTV